MLRDGYREEATLAVERGGELLDEHLPGWEREVNLEALQMDLCTTCMLGQLYGTYEAGKAVLWPDVMQRAEYTVACGFNIDFGDEAGKRHAAGLNSCMNGAAEQEEYWRALAECWVEAVKDRFGG